MGVFLFTKKSNKELEYMLNICYSVDEIKKYEMEIIFYG